MIPRTGLQRRFLNVSTTYAPTLEVLQMNERATDAWQERARLDPTGTEAHGLPDILALSERCCASTGRTPLDGVM
jgi:hypothetical protein